MSVLNKFFPKGLVAGAIFLSLPLIAFAQVTDLPAGPYGGRFRDESTGKIWLDYNVVGGNYPQKLATLSSTPYRLATTAELQAMLQPSILSDSAVGPLMPCIFGSHPVSCKYGIFDDSSTGSNSGLPGLGWGVADSGTVHIENDGIDSPASNSVGAWAVQRAPALRPSSDPLSSDFNGDGIDEKIVWRKALGVWFIRFSGTNEALVEQWGLPGDVPIVGDYDGDQIPDLVVWRPSDGNWYVKTSSSLYDANYPIVRQFGLPGDVPMRGDYDADGKLDYTVWRPSEGNWYVLRSSTGQAVVEQWGLSGDIPVTGGRGPN